MRKTNGKRTNLTIIAILALGVGLFLAIQYYGLGADRAAFVADKWSRMNLSDLWYDMLYLHIGTAMFALVAGWTQFVGKLREQWPAVHRIVGMIYAVCVGLSGIAGIYLAFYATGGWVSSAGFLLLSLAWVYTMAQGVRAIIVEKDVRKHRSWMIRNYALTFAAVTLRIYIPAGMALFGPDSFDDSYRVIAWLCWVPNLIFAEALSRRKRKVSARKTTRVLR